MAKRVRILYVVGSLEVGGAETQLVELMGRLDRQRYEPVLCCLAQGGPLEQRVQALGIPYHICGFKGLGGGFRKNLRALTGFLQFYFLLWRYRPTIVHCFLFWANVIGAVMARFALVPIVITSRRSLGYFKDRISYMQALEDFANRLTDVVTVNSKQVWADVLQRERIKPEIIRLTYNGVNSERVLRETRREVREGFGIPEETTILTCVANLFRYKGHRDLLAAFAQVKAAYDRPLVLMCVGRDAGELTALQQLANELGVADCVLFVGQRSDVAELLVACDIAVLASHEEGFSNAILEGMAAGRPQVVTDVGGNAEAIVHGVTGLVVPARTPTALAQAVLQLLNDPALCAYMGDQARKRAHETFSMQTMVATVQTIYQELLERKIPRTARRVFSEGSP